MNDFDDIVVRDERLYDVGSIHALTARAFAPMPFADGDEQDLVDRLRDAGALTLSLVADCDGTVIGHVAFTPAIAADGTPGWYALGPVSVAPERQRQGIGTRLIAAGLARLREAGGTGCVLVGNPAFYGRFGFRPEPTLAPAGEPAEYYQRLAFTSHAPATSVGFHPLFHGETI